MGSDEDDATEDVPEALTLEQAVASYRQNLPVLQLQVAQVVHEIAQELENIPDLRMREMIRKQVLMWNVFNAQLGALPMMLQMLWSVQQAMGCDVVQRRDN